MAAPKKLVNPFYVLLVLVGILFFVTASAYGVLTVRQLHGQHLQDQPGAGQRFLRVLDEHGLAILLGEVALLGLVSVAAMGTDAYWSRRAPRPTDRLAEEHQESSPVNQEKRP